MADAEAFRVRGRVGVDVEPDRVEREEGSSTTKRRELEAGEDLFGVPGMMSVLTRMCRAVPAAWLCVELIQEGVCDTPLVKYKETNLLRLVVTTENYRDSRPQMVTQKAGS